MKNRTILNRKALSALLAVVLAAGLITAPVSVFADTASSAQETTASASVSTDPLIKAEHYTIDASLNTKTKQITESVTMHVVNNSEKTVSQSREKLLKMLSKCGIPEDKIENRYYSQMLGEKQETSVARH